MAGLRWRRIFGSGSLGSAGIAPIKSPKGCALFCLARRRSHAKSPRSNQIGTASALMPAALLHPPHAARDRALCVSEARYRGLFETTQDGILLLNPATGEVEDVNPRLIKMLGYSHVEFLGKHLWEVGAFADIPMSKEAFADLLGKGYVRYENLPLRTKAGASINGEVIANSYDCEGVQIVQVSIHDVTDRTLAEARARRHERLYVALSQCNHAIVHSTKEEELFPEICRIAVQLGAAKMAWVGVLDTASSDVRPVASWGDVTGYLEGIKVSAKDDTPFGAGPIGQAIRGNQPVWLEDFVNDPRMIPWRDRMPLSLWAASGAIPLHNGGDVLGVLCVYSDKAAFFDALARGLLCQLAMDISFGLAGFARELHRKRAEEALQKSEEQFHTLAEAMPQIVWISLPDGSDTYHNQKWIEYTGRTNEESLDHGWDESLHPDDRQPALDAWQKATAARNIYSVEIRLRRADGVYRWWLVRGVPQQDGAGNIIKWFGTSTDIHDLKVAEIKIKRLNRVYAVSSGINAIIVRATDRDALFREACRIAVEEGGFLMSVMCLIDQSTMSFTAVGSAGKDEGLLALVKATLSSADEGQKTLSALAFRKKIALVVNDPEQDPRVLHGAECIKFGVRSIAALPVMVSNEPIGVLTLYAEEANFFNEDEMALLAELVSDIAFGIDHINKDERLKYLSYYDELTGLANCSLFLERVGQYLRGEVGVRHRIALVLVDLDRFKNINDSLGRPAGDALLKQVGEWLARNRGIPTSSRDWVRTILVLCSPT